MEIFSKRLFLNYDEPVAPVLENSVVYDKTLGKDKVILTKEYMNKYINNSVQISRAAPSTTRPIITFINNLEIWVDSITDGNNVTIGTNGVQYKISDQEEIYSVNTTCVVDTYEDAYIVVAFEWASDIPGIIMFASRSIVSYSSHRTALIHIKGLDTIDNDETNLGSKSLIVYKAAIT